jgi:phytoene dehydrogenase-like protein
MSQSIIIIGGGIAGLATGCYARMNGYEARIFEMRDKPGGLCTAWKRGDYTIDGCLHWLVGSAPGNDFYNYWRELGMIQGQTIINMDQFFRYEAADGRVFTMYSNADRLEQHMLELAPEDATPIREFCQAVRRFSRFNMLPGKPSEISSVFDKIKMFVKILPFLGIFRRWSKLTVADISSKFKSPLLREALKLWGDQFAGLGLLVTLGWLHHKVAGYVIGGSMPLARAVEKRFLDLGGNIIYKSRVEKILVENDRAVGVRLENGEEHRADIVISAADGRTTIFDFLGGKYIDDTIRGYYEKLAIFSPLIYVGLGVNRKFDDLPRLASLDYIVLDKPARIADRDYDRVPVRVNNFDPTMAPEGKTVLIIMLDTDYDYWKTLRQDMPRYKEEKEKTAQTLIGVLDRRFPGLAEQVEMTDVSTPVTFERYTGNWKGSFEGWLVTPKTLMLNMKKTLPGLGNFYMVGQWVSPGGGLPCGPMTGRYVLQLVCHQDKKRFVTTVP